MTLQALVAKWSDCGLCGCAGAQSLIDLCKVLGEKPPDPDPKDEWCAFEKAAMTREPPSRRTKNAA